jgi:predicted nucleotidyltransferase
MEMDPCEEQIMMSKEEIVRILAANREALEEYSVKELYVFGSVVRNEAEEGSDVDLLVEFEDDAHIGLFTFARLRRFLGELLGADVDLVTPDALHRELRHDILREAVAATS